MRYYGITDKGLVRKNNQDNYIIITNKNNDLLALVCDGIGGGRAGDVASKMAIEYFSYVFSENTGFIDLEAAKNWLRYHVTKCNSNIYLKSSTTNVYRGMGTTLTGILVSSIGKVVINIGDSRVYCVDENLDFRLLTEDHTVVNEMVRRGELSLEKAKNHPKKNMLTNALGVWSSVRCDLDYKDEYYNSILICSDGLSSYVNHDVINKIMLDDELSTVLKARKLLNTALKVGGYDNITIIIIELTKDDRQ